MMGLPLGFAQPLVLLGLLSIPVLWWILRLIPPQPFSADPAAVPDQAEGGDATQDAVVAHAAAPHAGDARHPGGRRTVVEPAGRDRDEPGAAGPADRRQLRRRWLLGCAHAHGR